MQSMPTTRKGKAENSTPSEIASDKKKNAHDTPYNSDEEPPIHSNDKLNWRLDPQESLSDWTIEIISTNADRNKTYHVHKNVLAVGDRRSEYFYRLFQNQGRFTEFQEQISSIELIEAAAKAFPILLDYLYDSDSGLEVTRQNAAALHYLGQYLEMRRLRWEAKQFWKADLTVHNCCIYYEHARLFHDEKIIEAVVEACCSHVCDIEPTSRLVEVSDLQLWLDVAEKSWPENSKHLSTLIAKFCSTNELDSDMFLQLTDEKCLPKIHPDAARALIETEKCIIGADTTKLSSLQHRCIEALANNWLSFDSSKDDTLNFLSEQSPALLANLTVRAISNARRDYNEQENKLMQVMRTQREQETAIAQARKDRTQSEDALALLRKKYKKTKKRLPVARNTKKPNSGLLSL